MICTQVSAGSGAAQMAIQGFYPNCKVHLESMTTPVMGILLKGGIDSSYDSGALVSTIMSACSKQRGKRHGPVRKMNPCQEGVKRYNLYNNKSSRPEFISIMTGRP